MTHDLADVPEGARVLEIGSPDRASVSSLLPAG